MRLIAFTGKKQSGKDTTAKFLANNLTALFGTHTSEFYYFGSPMKGFAENYLGIPSELLWGTDQQKNTLTNIKWRQLPHFERLFNRILIKDYDWASASAWRDAYADRFMTVRELLQQIGEEMFLGMYPAIWTRQFEAEVTRGVRRGVELGLCPDARKPEQIDTIHRLGGRAIRLLRDPYEGSDRHVSETALDPGVYDQTNFDAVVDNRRLTVEQTNRQVLRILDSWGWTLQRENEQFLSPT